MSLTTMDELSCLGAISKAACASYLQAQDANQFLVALMPCYHLLMPGAACWHDCASAGQLAWR